MRGQGHTPLALVGPMTKAMNISSKKWSTNTCLFWCGNLLPTLPLVRGMRPALQPAKLHGLGHLGEANQECGIPFCETSTVNGDTLTRLITLITCQ